MGVFDCPIGLNRPCSSRFACFHETNFCVVIPSRTFFLCTRRNWKSRHPFAKSTCWQTEVRVEQPRQQRFAPFLSCITSVGIELGITTCIHSREEFRIWRRWRSLQTRIMGVGRRMGPKIEERQGLARANDGYIQFSSPPPRWDRADELVGSPRRWWHRK